MKILQSLNTPPPADLAGALDGRTPSGVAASLHRLALTQALLTNLEHDCRTLTDCACGLPDLARLSQAETIALGDLVSYAHALRGRARQHLPLLAGATDRERQLVEELARRGQL